MATNSSCDKYCKLCTKELDRVTSDSACVVCEAEHTSWIHQRCFDKAIDKAIRVRSSKSTSFENIARSPTRFFKTQKCPEVNCIKWLAEYTPHTATDPMGASSDKPEGQKVITKSVIAQYEDNGDEDDEDSTQCSATKVDGTRCNFTISDQKYRLCRRCSEKASKQRVVTESLQSDNSDEAKSSESSRKTKSLEKEKDKEKKKSKSSKGLGLNSMLKSLAKPSPPPLSLKDKKLLIEKSPSNNLLDKSSPKDPPAFSTNAPPGFFPSSFTSSLPASPSPEMDKLYPPPATLNGEVYEVPEVTPNSDASLIIVPPSTVSNESELLNAVRYFIDVHSEGGRTTPREIARYLGTLRGGGGVTTAIEVMRARFHKLRNLVEAFPKLFELHEPSSRIEFGGPEYEVSLVQPQAMSSRGPSRTPSPINPPASSHFQTYEWQGDSISKDSILSLMIPPNTKIPKSLDHVLDFLDLKQFHNIFREHEFLPCDLFLVTDDDLKDIGIPPGPLVKLRNWVNAQTFAA